MKVLLAAGGDIFILDSRHRNVIMLACDSALPEQARLVNSLLWSRKGVRAKLETRDAAGCSALLNAVFKSNVWVVRELLLAGTTLSTYSCFASLSFTHSCQVLVSLIKVKSIRRRMMLLCGLWRLV